MSDPMIKTTFISIVICLLNYISVAKSNLSSSRTIFVDSLTDLMFPLLSMLSLHHAALDRVISIVQLGVILVVTGYFLFEKLTSNEDPVCNSWLSILSITLSLILSMYCISITSSVADKNIGNFSIVTTGNHFRIDAISKLCVLVISAIGLLKTRRKIAIMKFVDMLCMVGVLYIASYNLFLFLRGGL